MKLERWQMECTSSRFEQEVALLFTGKVLGAKGIDLETQYKIDLNCILSQKGWQTQFSRLAGIDFLRQAFEQVR
jgi:hypothetical protein